MLGAIDLHEQEEAKLLVDALESEEIPPLSPPISEGDIHSNDGHIYDYDVDGLLDEEPVQLGKEIFLFNFLILHHSIYFEVSPQIVDIIRCAFNVSLNSTSQH